MNFLLEDKDLTLDTLLALSSIENKILKLIKKRDKYRHFFFFKYKHLIFILFLMLMKKSQNIY